MLKYEEQHGFVTVLVEADFHDVVGHKASGIMRFVIPPRLAKARLESYFQPVSWSYSEGHLSIVVPDTWKSEEGFGQTMAGLTDIVSRCLIQAGILRPVAYEVR